MQNKLKNPEEFLDIKHKSNLSEIELDAKAREETTKYDWTEGERWGWVGEKRGKKKIEKEKNIALSFKIWQSSGITMEQSLINWIPMLTGQALADAFAIRDHNKKWRFSDK